MIRFLLALFTFLVSFHLAPTAQAQDAAPGDVCTTPNSYRVSGGVENAGTIYTMTCQGGVWVRITESDTSGNLGIGQTAPKAALHIGGETIIGNSGLACSATTEGAMRWNSTGKYHEFCDGTDWRQLVGVQSTTPPTAPAGAGYFVMTATTWDGDLGGLSGADAKCLTELSTTYTNWNGYTDANTRGLLNSTHVKAFLCNTSTCNNLIPLTSYYFATAGNVSAGGASFTTDAVGRGPQDSAIWSAANRFSGTYSYWTNRSNGTSTLWGSNQKWADAPGTCSTFSSSSPYNAPYGTSSSSSIGRWQSGTISCSNSFSLICFVNP